MMALSLDTVLAQREMVTRLDQMVNLQQEINALDPTLITRLGQEHPEHSPPVEKQLEQDLGLNQLELDPTKREMRDKAYKLCRNYLSGKWKEISSNDMIFKTISGGLSNFLFYCSLPSKFTPLDGEPSQVLLRMYGQIHETGSGGGPSENTMTESVICMLLAERGIAPKLYGVFKDGRLEEYIPARNMKRSEMRESILSAIIARKLASVHCLDVPINKEPTWLFDTMKDWLKFARTEVSLRQVLPAHQAIARELIAFNYDAEIRWIKSVLRQIRSRVVFCHNDLQSGNILIPTEESVEELDDEKVVFIDFEYCSYNFRAFDIGNHFCEHMMDYNGNAEYPFYHSSLKWYPDEKTRRSFIRKYIEQWRKSRGETSIDPVIDTEDHILMESAYGSLASHLLWTLWSIKNAYTSDIQFGYWDYGKTRLNCYLKQKEFFQRRFKKQFDSMK